MPVKASPTYSLRAVVAIVVAVIVLPVWGYAVFASWQYTQIARAALESEGEASARSVASTIQFRMNVLAGVLRSLEQSDDLKQGRLSELYDQAVAFAQTQGVVIGFNDASGRQIFNTNAAFGAELPPALDESRYREAIASNKMQASDLIYGNVTKVWLLAVARPVERPNAERAALIVAFDAALQFEEIFSAIHLPPSWAVAVIDGVGRVAGRRPRPEFAGEMAPASIRALAERRQPARGPAMMITGARALVFSYPIEGTGWSVLLGVPESAIAASVRDRTDVTLLAGLLVFGMSLASSYWVADQFARKFEGLSRLATTYRNRSTDVVTRPYRVQELRDLQEALLQAHQERDTNESSLRALLAEKELLMQEVHHRVKNSLQLVRGVLSLQARAAETPEVKQALDAAAGRIITIANVHHHLYAGKSVNEVPADDYFDQLARQLQVSLFPPESDRRIRVKSASASLRADLMTNLGLVATELITNSAKYGTGPIDLQFHLEEKDGPSLAVLAIADRGEGFPEAFTFTGAKGLGSRLIDSLIRGSGGTIEIQNRPGGSRVVVRVPVHGAAPED